MKKVSDNQFFLFINLQVKKRLVVFFILYVYNNMDTNLHCYANRMTLPFKQDHMKVLPKKSELLNYEEGILYCGNTPLPPYTTTFTDTDILNCKRDNRSRVCPVVICRHRQQINRDIFNRNWGEPLKVIPDHRGKYRVCTEWNDYNMIDRKIEGEKRVNPVRNDIGNKFNPGKGDSLEYLSNIDIESNLKNLHYRESRCPSARYNPVHCPKTVVDEPSLLANPMCQNYKFYEFGSANYTPNFRTKECRDAPSVRMDKPDMNREQLEDESLLRFNYLNNEPTCMDRLPINPDFTKIKQPLIFQYNSDIHDNHYLQTGPERTNHTVENIWNNVSKRRYI